MASERMGTWLSPREEHGLGGSCVTLTEHSEVGRGGGRVQEAITGYTGVAAGIIRLG